MHSAPRGARDAPRTRAAPQVVHTAENTYIVMELLSGGELFNRIVDKGCYPEKVRLRLRLWLRLRLRLRVRVRVSSPVE